MAYIHGTGKPEQQRLVALNALTNPPFLYFLDVPPGARVLDVGSGLGILAGEIARTARVTVGLEYSEEQLSQIPAEAPGLFFVRGDGHRLPFREGIFDLVYCRYLLEHVHMPGTVLEEMYRVLAPGGRVKVQENDILNVTFDPDCPAFEEIWRRFAAFQTTLGGDARIGKKLYALLSGAGFVDVTLSIAPEVHHGGLPTYEMWLENLIGNVRSAERAMIEQGAATEREIEAACRELEALKQRNDGAAFFFWTRAEGRKKGPVLRP